MKWRAKCSFKGVAYSRLVALTASLFLIFCLGCKSADKAHAKAREGKFFAVTADSAAFFRRGPQPGRAPDMMLPKETIVRLIRPSFGYSKIELVASGERGYVLSEGIKPASSAFIAAVTVPPEDSAAASAGDPPGEHFNIDSNDPRLVPPPEQLPNPDFPSTAPGPGE